MFCQALFAEWIDIKKFFYLDRESIEYCVYACSSLKADVRLLSHDDQVLYRISNSATPNGFASLPYCLEFKVSSDWINFGYFSSCVKATLVGQEVLEYRGLPYRIMKDEQCCFTNLKKKPNWMKEGF